MKYTVDQLPPYHYHPPKTAGASIITMLMNRYPLYNDKYSSIYKDVPDNTIHATAWFAGLDNSTPATISVRNPYTRYTSMLSWYKKYNYIHDHYTMRDMAKDIMRNKNLSTPTTGVRAIMYEPCYSWHKGNNITDIIYFETINKDLYTLYGTDDLPHIHQQSAVDRLDRLCNYSIAVINEIAHDDFEHYGYTKIETKEQLNNYNIYSTIDNT